MDDLAKSSVDDFLSGGGSSASFHSLNDVQNSISAAESSSLKDEEDNDPHSTRTVWSYLSQRKHATTLDIPPPSWYLENNLQVVKDWTHLSSSNVRAVSSDLDVESALQASTALFQQLDEVMAINNVLAFGAGEDSIKSLADDVSVVTVAKGYCHILKSLGDEDRILRLRMGSDQHPVHFFITGSESERPSQEDWPNNSEIAIWKSSSFANHPSVSLTIDCRKFNHWKSLLITAFNESNLLAHIVIKHVATGSQLKRGNTNSLTVKQNLKLKIMKIKCNQQKWKTFVARVKCIRQSRAKGHSFAHPKRKLDWQLLCSQKFILKLIFASRFLQAAIRCLPIRRNRILNTLVTSYNAAENNGEVHTAAKDRSLLKTTEAELNSLNELPPLLPEKRLRKYRVSTLEEKGQSIFGSFRVRRAKTYQPVPKSPAFGNMQIDARFSNPDGGARSTDPIVTKPVRLENDQQLSFDLKLYREAIRHDRLSLLSSLTGEPVVNETTRQRRQREARFQQKMFLLMASQQEFARLRSRPCSPPELTSRV